MLGGKTTPKVRVSIRMANIQYSNTSNFNIFCLIKQIKDIEIATVWNKAQGYLEHDFITMKLKLQKWIDDSFSRFSKNKSYPHKPSSLVKTDAVYFILLPRLDLHSKITFLDPNSFGLSAFWIKNILLKSYTLLALMPSDGWHFCP